MKRVMFVLALVLHFGAVSAQNEWVLQRFLQVKGDSAEQQLGHFVAGMADGRPNNPYNAVAAKFFTTGIYTIHSPNDTSPNRIYLGHNLVKGDLNGDNYTDLVIRQRFDYYAHDTVFVYLGSPSGIDTIPSLILPEETSWSEFGGVMSIGDLNGDGFDDLVITAPSYPEWGGDQGKVYIYMGGRELDTICDYTFVGDTTVSCLGWNCTIGDLNHDGYGDLVVSGYDQTDPHPDAGNRFSYLKVYFGSAQFDVEMDLYLKGADFYTLGQACFDVNGDGIADLLWGNKNPLPNRKGPTEAVLVFFGGKNFDLNYDFIIPHPDTTLSPICDFGQSIANAGDMNGDGYDDILIGAKESFYGLGMVFVYSGGKALDPYFDAARGLSVQSYFGYSLDGIGDVNGDGLADIIVGAPRYPWGKEHGYFAILLGDRRIPTVRPKPPEPPPPIPESFALHQNYPNPFNTSTTIRYDLPVVTQVRLTITDILGQEVAKLVDSWQEAGGYQVIWDGKNKQGGDVSSGTYFYKLEAGYFKEVKTMTLMR